MSTFIDVCRSYKGQPHQDAALLALQDKLPQGVWDIFLRDWRKEEPKPEWPLTKQQLGRIMGCLPKYLPDDLMHDLADCCETFDITGPRLAYFLGQCGEESGGLRYPMEIASGAAYEWRSDLGNNHAGDGVKFAGTGFIQCTGRANHTRFSNYLASIGKADPKVLEVGKTYTANRYPWTISGFWWHDNKMNDLCDRYGWKPMDLDIDNIGRRVNGVMPPRGAAERITYTRRALKELQP